MTITVKASRTVRLLALAGLCTFVPLIGTFVFCTVIQPRPLYDPVEEWIRVGIDLHRVDELQSMNVLTSSEYNAEYERVLADARDVATNPEFPSTRDAYREYRQNRMVGSQWSAEFWLALVCSFTLTVSALSWLHGASSTVSCYTDKTAKQNDQPNTRSEPG